MYLLECERKVLMTQFNFLSTLFDKGQMTCFSSNPYGTELYFNPISNDEFFSINAMYNSRADQNVYCFRNFLIELDNMPLNEQISYMNQFAIAPTSIVYSGGKSYHFIFSLQTPLTSIEDYRHVALRLHKKFEKADKSTKNPSRFSRLPFVLRKDTGKMQELIQLNKRINNNEFFALLPAVDMPIYTSKSNKMVSIDVLNAVANPDETLEQLGLSGRNAFFFWLGQRLLEAGLNPDTKHYLVNESYSNLKNKQDFTQSEAMSAARVK